MSTIQLNKLKSKKDETQADEEASKEYKESKEKKVSELAICPNDFGMWVIARDKGSRGAVPVELSGYYTHHKQATAALSKYLNENKKST